MFDKGEVLAMVSSWVSYISRDLIILNTSLSFWTVVPVTTAETVQLTNNKMLVSQNTQSEFI
jgi:hypothetical protein